MRYMYRFIAGALNDKGNTLNDEGGALNDRIFALNDGESEKSSKVAK